MIKDLAKILFFQLTNEIYSLAQVVLYEAGHKEQRASVFDHTCRHQAVS